MTLILTMNKIKNKLKIGEKVSEPGTFNLAYIAFNCKMRKRIIVIPKINFFTVSNIFFKIQTVLKYNSKKENLKCLVRFFPYKI